MRGKLKSFFRIIDTISLKAGNALSLLIFVIMFLTTVESVARYAFNRPTLWVWPLNRQLFAVFILIAGTYTMATGGHIRVEIFYDRFSRRLKKFAKYAALACFLCFTIALVLQGARMGLMALKAGEKASGAFAIPLYPLKVLIPVGAILLLLEGIVVFTRDNDDDSS